MRPDKSSGAQPRAWLLAGVFAGAVAVSEAKLTGASASAAAAAATRNGAFMVFTSAPILPGSGGILPSCRCAIHFCEKQGAALERADKRNHPSGARAIAPEGVKTAVAKGAESQNVDLRLRNTGFDQLPPVFLRQIDHSRPV